MTTIRTVLAATDFSAGAQAAAGRAAAQAAELGAALTLLHVVEPESFSGLRDLLAPGRDFQAAITEQARMMLEAEAAAHADAQGRRPQTLLREGSAVDEICKAGDAADLVAVGAHGGNGLRGIVLGTTADRLARQLRKPLLVVRAPAERTYRRVLVPVDFSDNSRRALQVALAVAPAASIHLVHCVHLPAEGRMRLGGATQNDLDRYRAQLAADAQAQLAGWADTPRITGTTVRNGDVRMELSKMAQEGQADLVAIGKHGTSLLADTLLGSLTMWSLDHVPCDVLVVPAGGGN
jgi:nucleotide-binding universal stress UspA family protein